MLRMNSNAIIIKIIILLFVLMEQVIQDWCLDY